MTVDFDMGFDEISGDSDTENKLVFFNYENLNDKMKYFYRLILEGINAGKSIIGIENCNSNAAKTIFSGILMDHPELFWLNGAYTYYSSEDGNQIKPVTILKNSAIEYYKRKLDKATSKIVESTVLAEDKYERILMLHDYIVDHSNYDIKAREKYSSNPFAATSYGCLVENMAICSGYSKGFQLLLQKIGVSCGYISGICEDGERHGWNYVQFGKEYYYVDITYDDPLQKKSQYDNKSHSYFFITTKDILKSREIAAENSFIPMCTSLKYNYFVRKGLYFKRYAFDDLKETIELNGDNKIEFRFATQEAYDEAVRDLFDNDACYRLTHSTKLSYQKDDELFIIALYYN